MSSSPCRCSTAACRSRRRTRGERRQCLGPSAVDGTPVASAKTTPLTMIGVAGAERLCETHPGARESAPARPSSAQRRRRRSRPRSWRGLARRGVRLPVQVSRLSLLSNPAAARSRVLRSPWSLRPRWASRHEAASRDSRRQAMRRRAEGCGRPSWPRIDVFAVGVEDRRTGHEFRRGCVNQSFNCRVFASSATIALALPSPVVLPAPIAAMSVPSDVKATSPITSPPLVFHDTTGFASLSRSIAQTAVGALPQFPDVAE